MKKLARLTALLLTGALLLVLTACGAAPLTPEQQAKKQILAVLNEYRRQNGAKAVDEIPELSKAEQFWVETFRKAGDYKVPTSEFNSVYQEYQKMIPSGWENGSYLGWDRSSFPEYIALESTDPLDTAALMKRFAARRVVTDTSYTAVGIGVATINGKIYWACTLYAPKN